ncbi:MAG TPA: hypothetical protein VJT08_18540 [Terriglobales bacterium]|nr:hypothetical protein [Terriglobales bacterium]
MDTKTATTKFRYRIEPKPGGGFIARAEEGPAEIIEGATQEELQQKLNDKFTGLVGEMLHNDKLTEMVGDMLHDPKTVRTSEFKLGGAQIRVNVTAKSSATSLSQSTNSSVGDLAVSPSAQPRFENSNKLWLVIALSVALGAVLMYLLRR